VVDDPRDRTAYRIAIGMLGLALVFTVLGVCWAVAEHKCPRNIPEELWFLPAAVGGVFVGALIPFSVYKRKDPNAYDSPLVCAKEVIVGAALLAIAAVATGVVGAIAHHLLALSALGTALSGVFFGLFIPSPGRRDT
jgi:hypothetical protein